MPIDYRATRALSYRTVLVLVALCQVLLVPQWEPSLIDYSTLDGAHQAVFSQLAFSDLSFGRDIVYTCGPYGWLRGGKYWPGLYPLLIMFGLYTSLVMILLFVSLTRSLSQKRLLFTAIMFAVIPLVACGIIVRIFYAIDCLIVLAAMAVPPQPHEDRLTHFAVGSYLAVSALVFFPQMVAAIIAVAFFTVIRCLKNSAAWVLPLTFLLATPLWWLAANQDLATFPAFLKSSIEVARAYPDVMATTGPVWQIFLALFLFATVAWISWLNFSRNSRIESVVLILGLSAVFFIAFKQAFVRHQANRLVLPVIVVLAILAFQGASWEPPRIHTKLRQSIARVAAVFILGVGSLVLLAQHQKRQQPNLLRIAEYPFKQLRAVAHISDVSSNLQSFDEANRSAIESEFPLPAIEGPVDLFGDLQGILLCHELEYSPRPVFQQFTAYSKTLSSLNAEFIRSPAAPPTLLVHLSGFGGYPRPFLDSASFLEIMQSYRISEFTGELAVLRSIPRRVFEKTLVLQQNATLGEWVNIPNPSADTVFWVEISLEPTLMGIIAKTLFKAPRLVMDLSLLDGTTRCFQFASPPAADGFWLSPTIQNTRQFARFLRNGADGVNAHQVVTALRVHPQHEDWSWAWGNPTVTASELHTTAQSARDLTNKPE